MWRFEICYVNEVGFYCYKGFGYADQCEQYLEGLVKRGVSIVDISDWDAEGIGAKLKAKYLPT